MKQLTRDVLLPEIGKDVIYILLQYAPMPHPLSSLVHQSVVQFIQLY